VTYKVVLTDTVRDAIETQILFYRKEGVSEEVISRWLAKLIERVDGLYEMPLRHPVAELITAAKGLEVRRLHHGEHALFYCIDEEAMLVEVVAFRHGRRQSQ
jgi:plasmid stabilization system protein ParE